LIAKKSSSRERRVGVLIIGGGIIGLAIAYYLSRRNFSDLLLIEKERELTMHASGHNAGGIAGVHETVPVLWPLIRETHRLYRELVEARHFVFDFERNGTISLDPTLDEKIMEEKIEKFKEESKAPVEFLDGSDLEKREPNLSFEFSKYGLFYPDDAQGNSKKLGQCFVRVCHDSGIGIETNAEVIDFEFDRGRIQKVRTSAGTFIPETIVIAAGPWSNIVTEKFEFGIPIKPIKGHLITTEPSSRLVHSFIDGPNYYVMQTSPGNLVIGGGEDNSGFDLK
jgi:glycine/D-amino acid oxidase-like deaminating enzyme